MQDFQLSKEFIVMLFLTEQAYLQLKEIEDGILEKNWT